MKQKILNALLSVAMLTSCADQYKIAGNSSVPMLDGRMLYLKVVSNNNMYSIDSCEVVHGKFNFMGMMDSIVMAELYMDDESVMPLVLENGNLTIRIGCADQRVLGGSLNEKLYHFIEKKTQLDYQLSELSHREVRLIMNGEYDHKKREKLQKEALKLTHRAEELETEFIRENYNNVLGPGVFMLLCGQYRYPIITEQIKDIMSKATVEFRNHPFVREYMRTAELNMKRMRIYSFPHAVPAPILNCNASGAGF